MSRIQPQQQTNGNNRHKQYGQYNPYKDHAASPSKSSSGRASVPSSSWVISSPASPSRNQPSAISTASSGVLASTRKRLVCDTATSTVKVCCSLIIPPGLSI